MTKAGETFSTIFGKMTWRVSLSLSLSLSSLVIFAEANTLKKIKRWWQMFDCICPFLSLCKTLVRRDSSLYIVLLDSFIFRDEISRERKRGELKKNCLPVLLKPAVIKTLNWKKITTLLVLIRFYNKLCLAAKAHVNENLHSRHRVNFY